jgi:hypothetical protein
MAIRITPKDSNRLEAALERLADAQAGTEERVTRLEAAMERLARAQAGTEERVTRLEEAVARLEAAVERLAQAQARSEERLTRLEAAVERLAQAQARSEERLTRLEAAVERLAQAQARTDRTLRAMGARWGLFAEESFREGIRAVLEDAGFKVERYLAYDHAGKVFDRPDQVELDMIIHNDKLMILEIKSSVSKGDVALFNRKTCFYEESEGERADRRILISPFVDRKAGELAADLGIEVYAQPDDLATS